MSEQDVERRVTEWLVAGAPSHAPTRVLTGALVRVAEVPQGRWARVGAGAVGRHRVVRWGLLAALLVGVLAGTIAVGAWLLRGSSPLPVAVADGWIAVTEAGPTRQDPGRLLLVRDGGEAHALTGAGGSPVRASCATFSPDGSRLAYVDWADPRPDAEGRPVIVTIDRDGLPQGSRVEPAAPVVGACPRWSPDGQALGFLRHEGLVEARLDGSLRSIAGWQGRPEGVLALDWAPDGSALVVTAFDAIWVVPRDGGDARMLDVAGPGEQFSAGWKDAGARWSADGRIAYPVRRDAGSSIRVRTARGDDAPLDLDGDAPFAWSPDGSRIAWTRPADPSDGTAVVVGTGDGSAPRRRARFEANVRALAWSPDGTRLVVAVDAGGPTGRLFAIPVDGRGEPAFLTPGTLTLEWTTSEDLSWQATRP